MTRMATKLLLATDFDGTASTLAAEAGPSQWEPAAWGLFSRLADRHDVTLAVVSGRPMIDIVELTRDLRCFRAASFGAEIHAPDGTVLRTFAPFTARLPDPVIDAVDRAGMSLENKPHGLALHWHNTSGQEHDHVVRRFIHWAESKELRLINGRRVVEAVHHGFDKASALELIASTINPELVIYCGDDSSDEEALMWAASRGKAFFVQNSETTARAACEQVEDIHALWQRLGALMATLLDQ